MSDEQYVLVRDLLRRMRDQQRRRIDDATMFTDEAVVEQWKRNASACNLVLIMLTDERNVTKGVEE